MKCEQKKRYETEDDANIVAKRIFEQQGEKRYSYLCPKCSKYHLTSMSKQKLSHVLEVQKKHRVKALGDEWERKFKIN